MNVHETLPFRLAHTTFMSMFISELLEDKIYPPKLSDPHTVENH